MNVGILNVLNFLGSFVSLCDVMDIHFDKLLKDMKFVCGPQSKF